MADVETVRYPITTGTLLASNHKRFFWFLNTEGWTFIQQIHNTIIHTYTGIVYISEGAQKSNVIGTHKILYLADEISVESER